MMTVENERKLKVYYIKQYKDFKSLYTYLEAVSNIDIVRLLLNSHQLNRLLSIRIE